MNDAAVQLLTRSIGDEGLLTETLTARDVMTTEPTCVGPGDSVLELVRIFHDKQFRHLLVTNSENELLGVVSDRDVVRCFGPTDFPDQTLLAGIRTEAVMSPDVITIEADATVIAAIDLMYEQGVSCLPVLDGNKLAGIVTTSDLLQLLRRILAG